MVSYINILGKDLIDAPFFFKFDETTTQQIKKQYDSFVTYYSFRFYRTIYAGFLFVSYCASDDLVSHFLMLISFRACVEHEQSKC